MRERLDELDPQFIRPVFKNIFAKLQRAKCLKGFEFLNGITFFLAGIADQME